MGLSSYTELAATFFTSLFFNAIASIPGKWQMQVPLEGHLSTLEENHFSCFTAHYNSLSLLKIEKNYV